MPVTRPMRNAAKQARLSLQRMMAEEELVSEDTAENDEDEDVMVTANTAGLTPTRPIFETIETATPLPSGHCFIRPLGNGKYEVLTFNSAGLDFFGSIEFGGLVREDSTGERMKALEDVSRTLKDAESKVDKGLGSAKLRIFRFLKLPIELRFHIYDLTMRHDKTLSRGNYKRNNNLILAGVHLRGTCRKIYEETRSFFWRNNFRLYGDEFRPSKGLGSTLTENLRELTLVWWAFERKLLQFFRMLKACKKLKTLHLRLTLSCVDVGGSDYAFSKPQYLHQEEPAVAKFKRTNGFDELLSLRGLENITVENSTNMRPETLSDQEVLAFQSFLNQMLTQPEDPTVKKTRLASKKSLPAL